MYTDKKLAVLREYSSNAWDAHKMYDKGHIPIKVTLPTNVDPVLSIRDYGPGMSVDEVINVYTQYGMSTKTETNDAVGMMGVGSKSGFSYSDSFTVISWHGGYKRVFNAMLDESDVGEMHCIFEAECDENDTGIEVRIPVVSQDVFEFRAKAKKLFKYFDPQPEINCSLEQVRRDEHARGFISDVPGEWVAIMGCIPYKLDLSQVQPGLQEAGMAGFAQTIGGGLYFNIGEVAVASSREELRYSDSTKLAIVRVITTVINDYLEASIAALKSDDINLWDKRQKVVFLSKNLGFTMPSDVAWMSKNFVPMWDGQKLQSPVSFRMTTYDGKTSHGVPVNRLTRLVVIDSGRSPRDYEFSAFDTAVVPLNGSTIETVMEELKTIVNAAQITGIVITTTTEAGIRLDTSGKRKGGNGSSRGERTAKHKVAEFILSSSPHVTMGNKHSDNWEPHVWEPGPNDVYVVMSGFVPLQYSNYPDAFVKSVQNDNRLAKMIGIDPPVIYGYKTTVKKPMSSGNIIGVEYSVWRAKMFENLVKNNQDVSELFEFLAWFPRQELTWYTTSSYGFIRHINALASSADTFSGKLPDDHIMVTTMAKVKELAKVYTDNKRLETARLLLEYASVYNYAGSSTKLDAIRAKYPLMFLTSDATKWHTLSDALTEYVKTCDLARTAMENQTPCQ